ncbi:MAG: hypothetical protein CVU07_00135 [Bacteroidetes bacterium HGW-Bacteroidetes-23]|nr:MAG: hypothetical protein CVU07_00135 [Bacteroidetes bacterium HGW-Bacteroidetes-23]
MKKLFLFLAASTLALSSCSSDDDGGSNAQNFSFKANGAQKSFSTTTVTEQDYYGDGNIELLVSSFNPSTPSENISFRLPKGDVGVDAVWMFSYKNGSKTYNYWGDNFTIAIIENSNNRLKGTFTGNILHYNNVTDEYESVTLSEGTFDFRY